jgi:hypothetical protein
MTDADDGNGGFIMMAEILPDNERTHEIMKKRSEEEEIRK